MDIKLIQQKLIDLGYDLGKWGADGVRGRMTDDAIIAFKRKKGLRARAFIGPITYKMLMGEPLPQSAAIPSDDPSWLMEARRLMGQREIKGPSHNSWIAKGWGRLGASWFNDDETPWCGFFVAHCIDKAGLPYPKGGLFARAKAWLDWGIRCKPCYGCVVVFGRAGGGHVGFLVGQSATNYYVLGGNQRDAVNIMPLAKSRIADGENSFRWPAGRPNRNTALPSMSGGIVSTNEA